jgi:GT2 family glycosyltransferase
MNATAQLQNDSTAAPSRTLTVSVLIPTMNRPDDLKRALDSVVAQTRLPDEIVVVDQSTDNRTRIAFSETKRENAHKGIRFIFVDQEEKSLVKARNRALDESTGEVVCFLDDDVVLYPDYLERAVARFESDPAVGGLSGNVLLEEPAGFKWELRKALMRLFLLSDFKGRMTPSGFGYPVYEREIREEMEVEFLCGCNMIYRRSTIGGERFDEWFTGYSFREDADFSYRIARRAKVLMIPEARLHHYHSPSNRLDVEKLKKMETRNYHYLFMKYKSGSPAAKALFAYSLLGLTVIDFLEFALSWKPAKYSKWRAGVGSVASILMGRS